MQAVVTNWQPRNKITTPLVGIPVYTNSGIIKAVIKSGEKSVLPKSTIKNLPKKVFNMS